jgi:hypothetical protein
MQASRQAVGWQAGRLAGRQAGRQAGSKVGRKKGRKTGWQEGRKGCRRTEMKVDRQREVQNGRCINIHTDKQK